MWRKTPSRAHRCGTVRGRRGVFAACRGLRRRGVEVRRLSPDWPRILPLVGSLAAALASTSAYAQSAPPIQQRIDSVFENLPQNPAELAIPLSRRALAKRASVLPYLPEEPPTVLEGFGRVDKSAAVQDAEQPAVPTDAEENAVEEGSADAGDDDAARIPPPRPDPKVRPDGPVDLVAAPAAPEAEAPEPDLVAAAASPSGEGGSPEPDSPPARSEPDAATEAAEVQDESEAPAQAAEEETRPKPEVQEASSTEVARAPIKIPNLFPSRIRPLSRLWDPLATPTRPGCRRPAEPSRRRGRGRAGRRSRGDRRFPWRRVPPEHASRRTRWPTAMTISAATPRR
jgi:hypothetical protein